MGGEGYGKGTVAASWVWVGGWVGVGEGVWELGKGCGVVQWPGLSAVCDLASPRAGWGAPTPKALKDEPSQVSVFV